MSDERLHAHKPSPWLGEHLHRYHLAISYLKNNQSVLDIATGEGYGAAMLAQAQSETQVTAADAEQASVDNCSRKYQKIPNLRFVLEDATKLSFADNTFDFIVSFETLEHVQDYAGMLKELNRVLKPDGMLLLSTPNFPVNSPSGVIHNPYHIKEFTLEEMEAIVPQYLSNVQIMGQQYRRWQKKSGAGGSLGKVLESLFYARGIRKLPLGLKDGVMKMVAGVPHYPLHTDFALTAEREEIRQCKTFVLTANKMQ